MKALVAVLLSFSSSVSATPVPAEVSLHIDLQGASAGRLSVSPRDEVVVILQFKNVTSRPQRFTIYQYHPFHRDLPVPAECAVRFLAADGQVHPFAKVNGEWWSQYHCWSTTFPEDRRNIREIRSGSMIVVEVPLHEILRVPAGGEPEGWMWRDESGYQIGRHRFQVRFGSVISRDFILVVVEKSAETQPGAAHEPSTAAAVRDASDDMPPKSESEAATQPADGSPPRPQCVAQRK